MKIDLYSFVNERSKVNLGFKTYVINDYINANKRRFMMMLINLFFVPKFKPSLKYVFLGTKHADLIGTIPSKKVAIIGGVRDLVYCCRYGYSYIPLPDGIYKYLSNGLSENNSLPFFGNKFRLFFERNLNLNLFLSTDTLPRERWILSTIKNNLNNIIVVQHGIVQSKQVTPLVDGKYSDFVLCYNENQKRIYEQYLSKVSSAKVLDFGFYKNLVIKSNGKRKYDICLIDQPFGKLNKSYEEEYSFLMGEFVKLAQAESFTICIKKHPGTESLIGSFTGLPILDCEYEQSFLEAKYYIGLTSTYLHEAELKGCRVYQLRSRIIPQDIHHEVIDINKSLNIKGILENSTGTNKEESSLNTRFSEFLGKLSG